MVFERVHNCVLWMRIMWWCTTTYNDPKHEKSHLENRILKGKQWYSHLCSGTLSSSTSQMGVWGFPPHLIAQWNGRAPVLLQFQQIMSCPSPSKQTECGSCLDSLEWRSQRNRNCQQTVVGDYTLGYGKWRAHPMLKSSIRGETTRFRVSIEQYSKGTVFHIKNTLILTPLIVI